MTDELQGTLFDERFLGRHAGAIMEDPRTALAELVANAWDAYATRADIIWPDQKASAKFEISDNGIGMTAEQFERRWRTLDYNRREYQGDIVQPPQSAGTKKPRVVYGQNGRGRHAAFLFSSPYQVETWCGGSLVRYEVSKGSNEPLTIRKISEATGVKGSGCRVMALELRHPPITSDEVRALLSTRFLTDPNFEVYVDSVKVDFGDIPESCQTELTVSSSSGREISIFVIDTEKADRTTKQHGIAWWVRRRLVGDSGWTASDQEKIVDGRSEEARRYTFIVHADCLEKSVLPDWSGFRDGDKLWTEVQAAVQDKIRAFMFGVTREKRQKTKDNVRQSHASDVKILGFQSLDRWNTFLEELVDKCPSLGEKQVSQVMGILTSMEQSKSQYSLLERLHELSPDEIDDWDELLATWTLSTAKRVLDEIETRLKLIEEIRYKSLSTQTREVQDLQPLFERSLWVFGPQFESIEYTSNLGMTSVIRNLFGGSETGSLRRPDFVVLPEGSIGLDARPRFDQDTGVEAGAGSIVVVELKRPGGPIGQNEKAQAWEYIKELMKRGYVTEATEVTAFVIGDSISSYEEGTDRKSDNIRITPMLFTTFVGQAEKRMLNLHKKISEAPFMQEVLQELEEQRVLSQGELDVVPAK